jgi:predicted nucleic acid-binding protein
MLSLIDTDVMIDLSRGNVDAANYLDSLNDPVISIVTAQELIVGTREICMRSIRSYRRIG